MSETLTNQRQCCGTPSEAEIAGSLDRIGVSRESNLIAVLQSVQAEFGYLPRPAIEEVSRRTRIQLSRVYGVITFYTQFHTEPQGRYAVRCCRGTACHVRGGKAVIDSVRSALRIEDGGTTEDMLFTFETVACLGACALAPVMVVNDTYYGKMTPRRAQEILRQMSEEEA